MSYNAFVYLFLTGFLQDIFLVYDFIYSSESILLVTLPLSFFFV